MDRRMFIGAVTGSVLAAPLAAVAQPRATIPRIGFLSPVSTLSPPSTNHEAFRQALRELGYVDGRTIAIEFRSAEGKPEQLSGLAAELVRLKVDLIVTNSELAIRAAKEATSTIPIVMAVVSDPVANGFVAGLARPGGNITGLTNLASGLDRKRLELLRQAVARADHIAVLRYSPAPRDDAIFWQEVQSAAQALGIRLLSVAVEHADGFANAFAAMRRERADALIVLANSFFFAYRTRITELAAQNQIPAMYEQRQFVEAGGLMSYGPNIADLWRRAATYVDKILKGAKPADLPVEQPTKFQLVINLKTAKALGITIPQSVLLRADEVIQ